MGDTPWVRACGFWVEGWLRAWGFGFRVSGLRFRVWGLGFGVWGSGFRASENAQSFPLSSVLFESHVIAAGIRTLQPRSP